MKLKYGKILIYKNNLGLVIIGDNNEFKFKPVNYGNYYAKDLELIDLKFAREPTEKEKDEFITKEYSWGDVLKIHKISNIQIIEGNNINISNAENKEESSFSIYIDYKSTNIEASSLDTAIIQGLATKYGDSSSSYYAVKLLNMNAFVNKGERKNE